jgi:type 1 fimbriae regulatory protein FimE
MSAVPRKRRKVRALVSVAKGHGGGRHEPLQRPSYGSGRLPARPASELVTLRWDAIDLDQGRVHCSRRRNGAASVHPLAGVELRALRRVKRETPASSFVFVSERGASFTVGGFRRMVGRLGAKAGFTFQVHPHMLRHACGYRLANQGVDTRSLQHYLGHKNIQHTVRYTDLAPGRFKGFWKD